MNVWERVLAALRLERPDRVPVFLALDPYGDRWYTAEPSYAELLEACREYEDVVFDWHWPLGFFCSGVDLSIEWREREDGSVEHVLQTPAGPVTQVTATDWRGGGIVKPWITTVEDARRVLSVPFELQRADIESFRRRRAELDDCAVAQATFPDPLCIVGAMIAPEVLAIWTLEQRPLLIEMLDELARRIEAMLMAALEADVGPIYYFNGPEYALPPLMSPADFDDFVVAYDRSLVELVHRYPDRYVIIHSHGRVNRFLDRFAAIGMDGLNVLEPPPMGDVDLADAKRRAGGKFCLIGNIQYDDLARGEPDDVVRLVGEAIAAGAPGGGFILSPCASPYERPLPERASRNLIAYLKACRELGRYPIRN